MAAGGQGMFLCLVKIEWKRSHSSSLHVLWILGQSFEKNKSQVSTNNNAVKCVNSKNIIHEKIWKSISGNLHGKSKL